MDKIDKVDEIIHKELLPIQQMFKSFASLAENDSYRIKPQQFRKAALQIQIVIDIARGLTKEIENV